MHCVLYINVLYVTFITYNSGLNRSCFDNKIVTFEEHCSIEHNHLHYLYFYVLVMEKDTTDFTGPESYVYALVKVSQLYLYHMKPEST